MKLVIEIELGNAAFEHDPTGEVWDILTRLANGSNAQRLGAKLGSVVHGYGDEILRDVNGNTVGIAKLEETSHD